MRKQQNQQTYDRPMAKYFTMGVWGDEPIVWRVLEWDGSLAQVVSELAIDAMPFDKESMSGNVWECSDIRWWLNGPFKKGAFRLDEAAAIVGEITLLDLDEVNRFMPGNSSKMCRPTAYAYAKGMAASIGSSSHEAGDGNLPNVVWWLRTPGPNDRDVVLVSSSGLVFENGLAATMPNGYVRPTMRVDFGSDV